MAALRTLPRPEGAVSMYNYLVHSKVMLGIDSLPDAANATKHLSRQTWPGRTEHAWHSLGLLVRTAVYRQSQQDPHTDLLPE